MSLQQAVIVLHSYKEVEKFAKQFWHDLDNIVLKPRIDLSSSLSRLDVESTSIRLNGSLSDTNIRSLLQDLEDIVQMLTKNLPPGFIEPFADAMMPDLSRRITEDWLEKSVPSSLDDMVDYQKTLMRVDDFTG